MSPLEVVTLGHKAVTVTLLLAAPLLVTGMVIGLIVAIFQATTQIQEMTLTFVPKILIVLMALLYFASWMLEHLMNFAITTIEQIPFYIR